jgi:hypothetical protein
MKYLYANPGNPSALEGDKINTRNAPQNKIYLHNNPTSQQMTQ